VYVVLCLEVGATIDKTLINAITTIDRKRKSK